MHNAQCTIGVRQVRPFKNNAALGANSGGRRFILWTGFFLQILFNREIVGQSVVKELVVVDSSCLGGVV